MYVVQYFPFGCLLPTTKKYFPKKSFKSSSKPKIIRPVPEFVCLGDCMEFDG